MHSLFVFFSAHLPPQKASLMCGFAGRAGVVQVLGFCQSSANLYVLVNDLPTKGVDWTEAQQFFPICNTQCGDF